MHKRLPTLEQNCQYSYWQHQHNTSKHMKKLKNIYFTHTHKHLKSSCVAMKAMFRLTYELCPLKYPFPLKYNFHLLHTYPQTPVCRWKRNYCLTACPFKAPHRFEFYSATLNIDKKHSLEDVGEGNEEKVLTVYATVVRELISLIAQRMQSTVSELPTLFHWWHGINLVWICSLLHLCEN